MAVNQPTSYVYILFVGGAFASGSTGNWKEQKPTAEEIESHLPADALPEGAHLLWQGNTLCVNMPSAGGFMLMVR